MSEDGLDLDTIIALEGRITAALDRIAGAAAANAVAAQSAGEPSGELQAQTETLAGELAEAKTKAEEFGSELSEALSQIEGLSSKLSDAEAAQEALRSELDASKAALAEAHEQAGDAGELATAQEKADRLRTERDEIRQERNALAEELDAYRSAAAGEPAALLQALRDLRRANAALRESSETLRKSAMAGAGAPAPESFDAAIAAELLSLQAERAADAAEMQLILDELRPMTEGAANA